MRAILLRVALLIGLVWAVAGTVGCGGCEDEDRPARSPAGSDAPAKAADTPTPAPQAQVTEEEPWWAGEVGEEWHFVDQLTLWGEADNPYGDVPLEVHFQFGVAEATSNYNFMVDFGDGTKAFDDMSPTHTYEKPGTYRAIAKIEDGAGRRGMFFLDIYALPEGTIGKDPTIPPVPLTPRAGEG